MKRWVVVAVCGALMFLAFAVGVAIGIVTK